jgi:cytochrome c biogenesis protein CcmG/thiol:disulfide interchange protein DsbE
VKRFIWLVVLLATLALTACYSGSRPPRIGNAAPDFTLQDSDRSISLHDLRGKVVILNFWATWCPPCVEEMPSLSQLHAKLQDRGVEVLGVSVDLDDDKYHRFLQDHRVSLTTVRDPDQKTTALYGTFKFPETYIIDRRGIVRRKFVGAVDWNQPEILDFLTKL